jgi:zinc transport system substrate-binding protein
VRRCLLAAIILSLAIPGAARAAPPEVVVSIMPFHSLIAAVMDGIGIPSLIVKGGASPHDYTMRPSDAAMLSRADVVFWVGKDLELFLAKPLAALAEKAQVVSLSSLLKDEGQDSHIWLDPTLARAMVHMIARTLARIDPANASNYKINGHGLQLHIDALDSELATALAPVSDLPYVVFHDAYSHFEQRYGLNRVAAVTVNPQHKPGAGRIAEIRETMVNRGARCLFTEPRFTPALAATLVEDTTVRLGVLDPVGVGLEPGPDAYFVLMRQLAASLRDCLLASE